MILQSDPEGNEFRRLIGAYDNAGVKAVLYYMDHVPIIELTDELRAAGFTEEDLAPPGYKKVVVLHP